MKIRVLHAIILIIIGLVSGYVLSDHIMNFVRAIFSTEHTPHYQTVPFDGWLT